MIDIEVVNSFILFQLHRAENPGCGGTQAPNKYSIAEYREESVRQLAGLKEYASPPVFRPPTVEPGAFETVHVVKSSDTRKSCKVCYAATKMELKVVTYCSAPQCGVYQHCTQAKDCFEIWDSKDYLH